jgi:hypothetical protein
MRNLFPAPLLVCAIAAQHPATPQEPRQHLDLAVLYAGVKDHARAAEWQEFLAPRTRKFEVVASEDLSRERAHGFDVIIVDCPDPLVKNAQGQVDRIDVPKAPGITLDFGRPTIFVGGMAMIADRLKLKLGWL